MQNEQPEAGGGVAALDRAFAILSAFTVEDKSLTLTEIARRTGFYKSTVLRLLGALEHGGFIRKLDSGPYAVGPEPLRLAQIYQDSFNLRHVLEPILQHLASESGETSSIYVRQGAHRVVLHRVEPTRAVRVSIREGERFPIEQGASGKVLVAFSKPYRKGHEEIRDRMWGISFGERDPDTASAAVPILGVGNDLMGALTLSGPLERFGKATALKSSCKLLLAAAARASASLGGDPLVFAHGLKLLENEDFSHLAH